MYFARVELTPSSYQVLIGTKQKAAPRLRADDFRQPAIDIEKLMRVRAGPPRLRRDVSNIDFHRQPQVGRVYRWTWSKDYQCKSMLQLRKKPTARSIF